MAVFSNIRFYYFPLIFKECCCWYQVLRECEFYFSFLVVLGENAQTQQCRTGFA